MKSIVFITAYATTKDKQELLLKCINSMKMMGNDIMVISHAPLPEHIIKEVEYYVYDKDNRFNKIGGTIVWKQINNIRIERYVGHAHQYPIIRLLRSAFYLAKAHGYDFIWGTDFDCIYSQEDIEKLKQLQKQTVDENKKFVLFHPKHASWKINDDIIVGEFYDAFIYAGYVNEWIDAFDAYFPKTLEEFNNFIVHTKWNRPQSVEYYMFDALRKYQQDVLTIDGYIKNHLTTSEINLSALASVIILILPANDGNHYLYINYDENVSKFCKVYINDALFYECTISSSAGQDSFKLLKLEQDCKIKVEVYQDDILINTEFLEYSGIALEKYKDSGRIIMM